MNNIPHAEKYKTFAKPNLWDQWRKLVGATKEETVAMVINRYIKEGKDVFLIPCPPFEDEGLKKIWVHSLKKNLHMYYNDETIIEDRERLARIRRRVEDRLRTGANSGLGEVIIKLARELDVNLH